MTKIIALSGRKQSGKSTAGEYIEKVIKEKDSSRRIKLYSFADPLKQDICINLLGLTYDQCYGTDEDKNTYTKVRWRDLPIEIQTKHINDLAISEYLIARQVMEVIGTEIFRKLYNNIWVDATINKIKNEQYDIAILLDNRFPNEVDSVLENNGLVIRLARDIYGSYSDAEVALDAPFYDWSKFSKVVYNQDMTMEQKNHEILSFLIQMQIL